MCWFSSAGTKDNALFEHGLSPMERPLTVGTTMEEGEGSREAAGTDVKAEAAIIVLQNKKDALWRLNLAQQKNVCYSTPSHYNLKNQTL